MKQFFFATVIAIQVFIIIFLGRGILNASQKTLGVSVTTIKKTSVIKNKNSDFIYYHEPKENTVDEQQPEWLEEKPLITINSDALNEPNDYEIEKPPRTFRIIALGDSFTYGQFVSTTDNWVEILERKLNKDLKCEAYDRFEVINLGFKAYDTAYAVERYRLRGSKYNPDLIIWSYVNFERVNERLYYWIKQYDNEKSPSITPPAYHQAGRVFAFDKVREELGKNGILDYQKSYFKKMEELYSGNILFVLWPMLEEHKEAITKYAQSRPRTSTLILNPEGDLFFPDNHPNKQGHAYAADITFNKLKNLYFSSCNEAL